MKIYANSPLQTHQTISFITDENNLSYILLSLRTHNQTFYDDAIKLSIYSYYYCTA